MTAGLGKTILYTAFGSCANTTWRHARIWHQVPAFLFRTYITPNLLLQRRRTSESRPLPTSLQYPDAQPRRRHGIAPHMYPVWLQRTSLLTEIRSRSACGGQRLTIVTSCCGVVYGLWRASWSRGGCVFPCADSTQSITITMFLLFYECFLLLVTHR
jgi:hypothetical protein